MEIYNPFSLKNKTILVTGASSGIGRSIAIEASRLGARLIIVGRNKTKLNSTFIALTGEGHQYKICDITNETEIIELSKICGKLNGIVHCAGVGDRTLMKTVSNQDIERIMEINFNAPVLLQKWLLKNKNIESKASIVFIASRAPFSPSIGHGLYAASKGALIAYSKVLGLELAPRKIRVNCVCPGMVWTELIEKDSQITGTDYRQIEQNYPLGRYGKPQDIAYLVVYLLSDAAEWVTGSCMDITGGGEFTLK